MENKYKYVVVFIKVKDEILMLNRNKPYWMGMWNAVGGKIENGEDKYCSAIRETHEETGIKIKEKDLKYLADLNWYVNKEFFGGTYCFLVEGKKKIKLPKSTREGVLEWKSIDWILNSSNKGIVPDVPFLLDKMLKDEFCEINAYYDENDILIKIEEEDRKMDNFKDNLKKAGYVAVGAGAVVYEKGKEVYEKIAPQINETLERAKKSFNETIEVLNAKGEEVLNKNKKSE